MTKELVFEVLRLIIARVFGPGITPRVKGLVEQVFVLVFHGIDSAQSLWNAAGGLVANTARSLVSITRATVLGLIDAVDQFITGTYRAVNPKIEPPSEG